MAGIIVLLPVFLFSIFSFASSYEDVVKAQQITFELTKKCKELRKNYNLKETGNRLNLEAKKYEHLEFVWSENGSASLLYKKVRGMIMHSDCKDNGELPVDSI